MLVSTVVPSAAFLALLLLALATLDFPHAKVGTELRMEVTVHHERKTVKATVVKRPLFDPARKRRNFAAEGSPA